MLPKGGYVNGAVARSKRFLTATKGGLNVKGSPKKAPQYSGSVTPTGAVYKPQPKPMLGGKGPTSGVSGPITGLPTFSKPLRNPSLGVTNKPVAPQKPELWDAQAANWTLDPAGMYKPLAGIKDVAYQQAYSDLLNQFEQAKAPHVSKITELGWDPNTKSFKLFDTHMKDAQRAQRSKDYQRFANLASRGLLSSGAKDIGDLETARDFAQTTETLDKTYGEQAARSAYQQMLEAQQAFNRQMEGEERIAATRLAGQEAAPIKPKAILAGLYIVGGKLKRRDDKGRLHEAHWDSAKQKAAYIKARNTAAQTGKPVVIRLPNVLGQYRVTAKGELVRVK